MKQQAAKEPGRVTMQRVFDQMGDRDGNFREQFQSAGFDSRVWELYLYAGLTDAGFAIELPAVAPDYMAQRDDLRFAVEATTANLRRGEGSPVVSGEEELFAFLGQELPIRLGSPLFSKLQADYTKRKELAELPFVLALECFISLDSMFVSESSLGSYLFGLGSIPEWAEDGQLRVRNVPIAEHRVAGKTIPSGFFKQPGAEQISAVLFSNSGTVAKFDRMGYQEGIANDRIWMGRYGFCADNDPNSASPSFFAEEVGAREERWSEGLVVFHNPSAARPLPHEAFGDSAVQYKLIDGQIRHTTSPFHVFSSQTLTVPAPTGHGVEVARQVGLKRLNEIAAAIQDRYGSSSAGDAESA
jgi:hypothetical protein